MDQPPKLHCIHANFSQLKNELSQRGIHSITHLYVDLGVSSIHLDDPESTFSFQNNTKLDMRFDPTIGTSANEIIHSYSFRDLALIFRKYGDESLA